jgi:hypothetical protein
MEIEGYEQMIRHADGYFNTASRAYSKKSVFSDELIFNILTMSIEKFLVGLLMSKGIMPVNHVIKYLLMETNQYFDLDKDVSQKLEMVDHYLDICSIDEFMKITPSHEELGKLRDATEQLKKYIYNHVPVELA